MIPQISLKLSADIPLVAGPKVYTSITVTSAVGLTFLRVDSDLDRSRNAGFAGNTGAAGTLNTGGTTGGANYNDPRSTNAGPVSSPLLSPAKPCTDWSPALLQSNEQT
jgi:hypothetical protein